MKTLENYLHDNILESRKISAKYAIEKLKAIGDAPVAIKHNGKDMTTGYVRKGDSIQFCGDNFTTLCDCQYTDFQSKIMDYDVLTFDVFVKDSKGNPTLMSLSMEGGEGVWWPVDGWIEDKPDKELEALAKDAGLKLYWNGEYTEVR